MRAWSVLLAALVTGCGGRVGSEPRDAGADVVEEEVDSGWSLEASSLDTGATDTPAPVDASECLARTDGCVGVLDSAYDPITRVLRDCAAKVEWACDRAQVTLDLGGCTTAFAYDRRIYAPAFTKCAEDALAGRRFPCLADRTLDVFIDSCTVK